MKNLLLVLIHCYLITYVNGIRILPFTTNGIREIRGIGGIDEFGCITGAGYSYCNYTSECHRFDQPCIQKNNTNTNNNTGNYSEL